MSAFQDPLETELAALRPHQASPELKQRIAGRLESRQAAQSGRWRGLTLLGGAVAAGLLVVFLAQSGRETGQETDVPAGSGASTSMRILDNSQPTFWAYRDALARSSEDLDKLLARNDRAAATSRPDEDQISVWMRSDDQLNNILGDL